MTSSADPKPAHVADNHVKIALFGADGAGKSTLFEALNNHEFSVHILVEPTEQGLSVMSRAYLRRENWSAEVVKVPLNGNIDENQRKEVQSCDVILILVAINDRESLGRLESLKAQALQICGERASLFVAISKSDLADSIQDPITVEQATLACKLVGIRSPIMISAKQQSSLVVAMEHIVGFVSEERHPQEMRESHHRCNIL